ncbi:MAG: ORF6N domain-containing protein [Bacteroidales bacterium]
MLPDEVIMRKIYLIRGKKVMLDRDLAVLYEADTKQLKRAIRRNIERFPDDFMFELTKEELASWRYQFGTSNSEKMGLRVPPFAFTEHGVIMLASVLNSNRAIRVNIQIVRIFIRMREMLETHKVILEKLDLLERKDIEQDDKIMLIFEYLKQLERAKQQESEQKNRPRIGFKPPKEK